MAFSRLYGVLCAFLAILFASSVEGGRVMNLGARIGCWSGGGLSAKDYVQDGLLANFDAIENNGYGKHTNGFISQWLSLVGDGLINLREATSSFDSTSLVFDNTTAQAHHYHNLETAMNNSVAMEVVAKFDSSVSWHVLLDSATVKHGFCIESAYFGQPSRSYIQTGATNTYGIDGLLHGYYVKWGALAYIDDTRSASATLRTYTTSGLTNEFGSRLGWNTGGLMKANVCAIRMYSTYDADVYAANYAVDKARFGLT